MQMSRQLRAAAGAFLLCAATTPVQSADVMRNLCDRGTGPAGYVAAEPTARPLPYYPPMDLLTESEGWALLGYSIAANGTPQNIAVLDRMGSKHVLKASIDALNAWRYKPAQLRGQPIAQHGITLSVLYRFNADSTAVVHDVFTQKYNYGRAQLRNGKPREAIATLESAFEHSLVLHEQTMLSYALATAYWSLNDGPRALQYIRHALIEGGQFLDPKARPAARRLHLILEAKDSNFEFVACWKPPAGDAGDDDSGDVARIKAQVAAALANPQPLALEGTLATNPWVEGPAYWEHPLLRRKFAFDSLKGAVRNLRLTCQTLTLDGEINETSQWSVPDSAGNCVLRVFGDPGATFRLIEEW